jgi:hypothetical protein
MMARPRRSKRVKIETDSEAEERVNAAEQVHSADQVSSAKHDSPFGPGQTLRLDSTAKEISLALEHLAEQVKERHGKHAAYIHPRPIGFPHSTAKRAAVNRKGRTTSLTGKTGILAETSGTRVQMPTQGLAYLCATREILRRASERAALSRGTRGWVLLSATRVNMQARV